MSLLEESLQGCGSLPLVVGQVAELTEDGCALVSPAAASPAIKFLCQFMLDAHGNSIEVVPGDLVLVLPAAGPDELGCIIGKMGRYNPPNRQSLELEAADELTLKCGKAAIKLRSDGKILTQAVDISSIAQRLHKVRGGSVQIN